jgi:hypothetical protein
MCHVTWLDQTGEFLEESDLQEAKCRIDLILENQMLNDESSDDDLRPASEFRRVCGT